MGELNVERSNVKFDMWERKLLDLSTRNSLLNLKIKGTAIPLFVPDCAQIEDYIAQEKSKGFSIISRGDVVAVDVEDVEVPEDASAPEGPKELPDSVKTIDELKAEAEAKANDESEVKTEESSEVTTVPEDSEKPVKEKAKEAKPASKVTKKMKKAEIPAKDYTIEDLPKISEFETYINNQYEKGTLVSSVTPAVLENNLKNLYRGAKASMEENGANTLYLACGFLKWFEKDKKDPCYAPILLIPVELVKKFGIKYTMRKRDEDTQFNVTVSEKLRQDFGIEFDAYKHELPRDDSGVDVKAIFNQVQEVVMPLKWEVIPACVLGLFSFSQFVMWNDMHSHRDEISKNKIVKSLIEGKLEWEAKDISSTGKVPEEDVYLPIVADASQLAAIKCAGEGESFVLHGPPGTGKSQTITSIIANCLANGKKVLFASEKKAALDVVYKRLEKIGVAPFCLELHSNKVRKSYVLDQLKVASEVSLKAKGSGDYDKALEDIANKRKELDKYVDALHTTRGCGLSLYELINIYFSNQAFPDCGSFDEGFLNEITFDRANEIESSLGELIASSTNLQGKLPFVKSSRYSQEAKNNLPILVDSFVRAFDEFASSVEIYDNLLVANNCRVPGEPGTLGRISGLSQVSALISRLKALNLPKGYICCDDTEAAYLSIKDMLVSVKDAVAKRDAILTVYQPGFLDLDGAALLSEIVTAKAKNALLRGMAENNVYKKVKAYDLKGNRKEVLEQDFKLLADYKNSIQNAMAFIASARGYLGELYNPGVVFPGFDVAAVEALNENAHALFTEMSSFDPIGSVRKLVGSGDVMITEAAAAFGMKSEDYKNTYEALNSTYGFECGAFEPLESSLDAKKQMAVTLKADSDYLRDRMQFNLMSSKCRTYKIDNLVDAYSDGVISGKDLIGSFRKGYSKVLVGLIIDNADVLRTFSGLVFEQKISELSKLNDEFEKLTRQEIYLRIAKNLPDITHEANVSSALGILQHAIKSGGRGVSIRTLFTQVGDLILKLCPCVLMSPLSCAQYLDPEKCGMFDIVVFDEASQLPTSKAIGVIARGKEAVIVGDPKQMPPTSFFMEQTTEVEDFETDDLESILDDCLAISMPQMFLAWHYRSRHESLITFSNKSFYEGKLYTFPSPDDRVSKVTMVDCGGTFDSGNTRTNKIEAQAVIDEICMRAHDPVLSKYSVGVVTFNIQQQTLIEDMLDLAASKDAVLEKWAFGSEEPIFVKNLENVQGDERDVILFSVGYGKDETGKLIMNFGPLNRDGGWRRLNVAVTRSRIEMKVFASMAAEEIRIGDTASEGVKSFKRFLQYAAGSTVWDQDIASTGSSSDGSGTPLIDRNKDFTGIADDICARFNAIGFNTEKGVGKSGFKIDIGVVSPEKDGTYCLGILLDGPVYASSGTTTSREVSQISMLKGFGWNIARVWSIEWWENPDAVFEKLVGIINGTNKPEDDSTEEPEASVSEPESNEEVSESEAQAQKKTDDVEQVCPRVIYKTAHISGKSLTAEAFCDARNTDFLQDQIMSIIEQESPISKELIAKTLLASVGIERMTPNLKKRFSDLMNRVAKLSNIQYTNQRLDLASEDDDEEVIFVWKDGTEMGKVMDYFRVPAEGEKPRKACDIPVQEAACASKYLAKAQYGMPYENLIVETAKAMGFTRVPTDSDNYMLGKRAVDYSIRQELLILDDDGFVKASE